MQKRNGKRLSLKDIKNEDEMERKQEKRKTKRAIKRLNLKRKRKQGLIASYKVMSLAGLILFAGVVDFIRL
jgi:hypothetical protein